MKTLLLIATIFLGIVFPFTHSYAFLIQYLLMLMLFFSFIKMEIKIEHINKSHFYILLANILVPLFSYSFIRFYSEELAQIIFITAIAPTAIASPIIVGLLNGKMEFTVISIIITNFTIAFLLPFLLPVLIDGANSISMMDVLKPVATIFLVPLLLSFLVKKYFSKLKTRLAGYNKYVFYLLILNINLGTAKASNYISQEMSFSDTIIYEIAITSFLLCMLYFFLGKLVTQKDLQIEGGQSLGQKNNGFTVWVALTFISPLAVLGPVFYILFQNIYISWQLHKRE